MHTDLLKISNAEIIIARAGLQSHLISQYIVECLCLNKSASLEQLTEYVEKQVGICVAWRDNTMDDLFKAQPIKTLMHSNVLVQQINFTNQKLAGIDNHDWKHQVLLARIHKISIEIENNVVERYVLVHNCEGE